MDSNIINAAYCGTSYITTRPAWLIDYGMVLKLSGIELPDVYEVDFANTKTETAIRVLGGPDGVTIPDRYFLQPNAQQIFAWLYLHTGEDDGYTRIQVTIPLYKRPDVTDVPPTPEEHSIIEQAIVALNSGVQRSEAAAENAEQSAQDAADAVEHVQETVDAALQEAKDSGEFDGPPGKDGEKGDTGATPDITIGTVSTLEPGQPAAATMTGPPENPVLNLGIPRGDKGDPGEVTQAEFDDLKSAVTNTNTQVGKETNAPILYPSVASYTYPITTSSATVSDKIIPANSYIESVKIYTQSVRSGAMYFFDSNNKCVYKKSISTVSGWTTVGVNMSFDDDVRFGFYNLFPMYTNSSVQLENAYSTKIHITTPADPVLNDTVTISDLYTGNFALAIEWTYSTGIVADIADLDYRITNTTAVANEAHQIASAAKELKIYSHPCIVSFIDDDSGQYAPEIWGDILGNSGVRIGFACVTGFISGEETVVDPVYTPMTVSQLRTLYNAGHEVYSHSFSHPPFYSDSTTPNEVETQCRLSKQWLDDNGFQRNSDVIVYPGGLGYNKVAKWDVIRQFYRFGVDTIGGGINPQPIENPLCIYRYNADTATLDELKSVVDDAVSQGKLLVFMNHAYQLNLDKENQVAKMSALIDYIQSTSAIIIPFAEAIHRIYGWD